MDDNQQAKQAHTQTTDKSPSVLTPPSKAEENYLKDIEKAGGVYDPKLVVGGPSSFSA